MASQEVLLSHEWMSSSQQALGGERAFAQARDHTSAMCKLMPYAHKIECTYI